jgi:hypothetical protein
VNFKKQLGRLKVDFYVVDIDCRELAAGIDSSGSHPASTLLPQSARKIPTKFDRIEVSNTVDDYYVGFEHTLLDWGPHLNRNNPSSTLLAYTMNWAYDGDEGRPDQDDAAYLRIMKRMQQEQRVNTYNPQYHSLTFCFILVQTYSEGSNLPSTVACLHHSTG